jgi:hypothetical protein
MAKGLAETLALGPAETADGSREPGQRGQGS